MGEWVLGKQQGRGKFVSKEGEIYEGEFKGGRMHGKGRFLHSNGTICTFMKIVSSLRRWDISLLTVLRVTFLDDGNWDMDMKHGGALFYWVDGEVDACEYDGERLCYVFEIIRARAHTHIFVNSLIFDFILHYQATRA